VCAWTIRPLTPARARRFPPRRRLLTRTEAVQHLE
jgi:hypothetical protein